MPTMNVPDFAGVSTAVEKPNANGRQAPANSRPVALATDDSANLAAVGTKLDTLDTRVDGLETLITATNALLTTQNGYLDGVEALIASTNSLLTTQAAYVDGLEALIGATNTKLDTLNTAIASTAPSAVTGVMQLPAVAFTADTAILAAGDIIADTQAVAGMVNVNDALGMLQSLVFFDPDDQGQPVKLVFFSANVSLGTENAAPSISDANALNVLGVVDIAATDYVDWGGVRTAHKTGIGMVLKPAAGTTTVYVALVNGTGTPTYAGGAPRAIFGVLS